MSRRAVAIVFLSFGLLTLATHSVRADDPSATGNGTSIIEQVGCDITNVSGDQVTVDNPCQVNDFINLFVYLMKWGLSILGILAVLMIVYGGFQFLTAAGRASKVDEGRRVIIGTVVGTLIALSAYVIINTAVTAITGTKLTDNNPFGVIATVFSGKDQSIVVGSQTVPINAAFSGKQGKQSGTPSTTPACRLDSSGWDRDCSTTLQPHCADPGTTTGGQIYNYQKRLTTVKGCDCGGQPDGCYGPNTIACVREFQIANRLPPTGTIDAKTGQLINGGGVNCGANSSDAVAAQLPTPSLPTSSMTDNGCCVVKSGSTDLYCLDQVSRRTCDSIGSNDSFLSGYCANVAVGRCGYCSNLDQPKSTGTVSKCYQLASPSWCTTIGQNDLTPGHLYFKPGGCDGTCATCVKSLMIQTALP